MLPQPFIDEMKQLLLKKKQQLEEDLAGLSSHTELGDTDEANADEIGVDEASQDVIAVMQADIAKINKALTKISAGTYGVGDDGKEIPEARLRAMPWAEKAI